MSAREITPKAFDRAVAAPRPKADRILWTAEAIGSKVGVSADFVRNRLVHLEGTPVKKIGTRYCAHEGDLIAFFRSERTQA